MRHTALTHEQAIWAYGPDYASNPIRTLPLAWNSLHPTLFTIDLDDSVEVSESKIKAEFVSADPAFQLQDKKGLEHE